MILKKAKNKTLKLDNVQQAAVLCQLVIRLQDLLCSLASGDLTSSIRTFWPNLQTKPNYGNSLWKMEMFQTAFDPPRILETTKLNCWQ